MKRVEKGVKRGSNKVLLVGTHRPFHLQSWETNYETETLVLACWGIPVISLLHNYVFRGLSPLETGPEKRPKEGRQMVWPPNLTSSDRVMTKSGTSWKWLLVPINRPFVYKVGKPTMKPKHWFSHVKESPLSHYCITRYLRDYTLSKQVWNGTKSGGVRWDEVRWGDRFYSSRSGWAAICRSNPLLYIRSKVLIHPDPWDTPLIRG